MPVLVRPVSYGPSSAADPAEGRSFGGAFWVSIFAHALTIALIVFLTLSLRDRPKPEPRVFELVAGVGDNFAANEAPAGSEAGRSAAPEIQFTAPEVPVWTPPPPVPVEAVPPPQPTPTPPTPPRPTPTPSTPVTRVAPVPPEPPRQNVRPPAAQPAPSPASPRVTLEEFQRTHRPQATPAPRPANNPPAPAPATPGPRLDPNAIRQGVTGAAGSQAAGAGGAALSAAEAAAMDRYFAMLMQRLREAHQLPPGLSDLLNAGVEFTISAGGTISGVRIVRSSGNAAFDQSVLDAFARVRMPARPDGKTDAQRLTFRVREA